MKVPRYKNQNLLNRVPKCVVIARRSHMPVIYIQTIYSADKSDWPSAWRDEPSWCSRFLQGAVSAKLAARLDVRDDDIVITKKRYSSFYNTTLDDILQNMNIDHLVLTGFAADVCVRQTGMDAYNRGYKLTLIEDAIEPQKEAKRAALSYLEWLTDATILSLSEFKKALAPDKR
ncbi:MAG: cysteine hydrolase [Alphaproteobacteria bacterium]|nr:cysteine hydrolase [Alphaproteobacteria bacterium]